MKNLFGLLFVCALFALTSCGDDGCDLDLSGTYTGMNDCAGVSVDATVTISGTDGDYSVSGVVSNSSLDQDGCTLSYEVSAIGVTVEKVTITLSGTTLTVVQELLGVTACTFTGTK